MVILSYRTIKEFSERYPDAEEALNNWYFFADEADWSNFNEMRGMYGSVDSVGDDLYVFNIRGGNYRLIVRIIFKVRTIYIRFIGTHKEYNKVKLSDL
ncbi:MAG: type II toxin-antitoxin system HigB family toxin [Chitinophagaceae bacterium]